MFTVGAIHSGATSMAPVLEAAMKPLFGQFRIINIIDDSLIHTVIRDGEVTPKTVKRVVNHVESLFFAGADVVVDTCSSIGAAAEIAGAILDKPVVRIDQGMVSQAVGNYRKIGVLASLSTTLLPTVACVKATAERMGRQIEAVYKVAEGAFDSWIAGDAAAHDRICVATAEQLGDVDVILLAQASMMRVQEQMRAATGKPVLSSPEWCARYLRQMFPDV